MHRTRVICDIETHPSERSLTLPCPPEWRDAVGNATKDETVAKKKAENEAAWPAERERRACLDWRLGEICAIGWQIEDQQSHVVCSPSEGLLLTKFWDAIGGLEAPQLVGFNILSFDLPWILGRSAVRRTAPSRLFRVNKWVPGASDVVDWADVLSGFGSFPTKGWTLARYAEMFGLPATIGEGKDVPGWMRNGETTKILDHLRGDLVTTAALDQLFRPVFCP